MSRTNEIWSVILGCLWEKYEVRPCPTENKRHMQTKIKEFRWIVLVLMFCVFIHHLVERVLFILLCFCAYYLFLTVIYKLFFQLNRSTCRSSFNFVFLSPSFFSECISDTWSTFTGFLPQDNRVIFSHHNSASIYNQHCIDKVTSELTNTCFHFNTSN